MTNNNDPARIYNIRVKNNQIEVTLIFNYYLRHCNIKFNCKSLFDE